MAIVLQGRAGAGAEGVARAACLAAVCLLSHAVSIAGFLSPCPSAWPQPAAATRTHLAFVPNLGRGTRAGAEPLLAMSLRSGPGGGHDAALEPRARLEFGADKRGSVRLRYRSAGWSTWRFAPSSTLNATIAGVNMPERTAGADADGDVSAATAYPSLPGTEFRVNYISAGEAGTPIVFVHGFGASAYHFRYQIAELSKTNRVFSMCLLGFGHSDKPHIEFSNSLWGEQLERFIDEVVGEPAVVVGNSLGGIVSLQAAAVSPQHVLGLVLMNVPGQFASGPLDASGHQGPETQDGKPTSLSNTERIKFAPGPQDAKDGLEGGPEAPAARANPSWALLSHGNSGVLGESAISSVRPFKRLTRRGGVTVRRLQRHTMDSFFCGKRSASRQQRPAASTAAWVQWHRDGCEGREQMQGVGVVAAAWRIALLLLLFPTLSLTQGGRALLEGIPSIYFGLLARLTDRCTVLAHLWLVVFSISRDSKALTSAPECLVHLVLTTCLALGVCVCMYVFVCVLQRADGRHAMGLREGHADDQGQRANVVAPGIHLTRAAQCP